MRYLKDKVAFGKREWRIVAQTNAPETFVVDGETAYEFAGEREAYQFVIAQYRKVADLRSMQPGQSYSMTMQDGTTKQVTVQQQGPQAVTFTDAQTGETMTVPHFQTGAEPKMTQPNRPNAKPPGPGGAVDAPGQQYGPSPENITGALCKADLSRTGRVFSDSCLNCGNQTKHLDDEALCPSCKTASARVSMNNLYFCPQCNTSRTVMLDPEGDEIHRYYRGRVVRQLSCEHYTDVNEDSKQPTWPHRQTAAIRVTAGDVLPFDPSKRRLKTLPKAQPAKSAPEQMVTVYKFPNGFGQEAQHMYGWLMNPGEYGAFFDPAWGNTQGGEMEIQLPASQVAKLRELQQSNPARWGNPTAMRVSATDVGREPFYCKHDHSYLLRKNPSDPERYCPNCGMVYAAQRVTAREVLADAPMPGQQGMPSGDVANDSQSQLSNQMNEKGRDDFAEAPEGQGPNAKRTLTPHEIIEEAESLIRNALVKGVKIGAEDLQDYMRQNYNNTPNELLQGIALAWQKVTYEEDAEADRPPQSQMGPKGPGAGLTPENEIVQSPRML